MDKDVCSLADADGYDWWVLVMICGVMSVETCLGYHKELWGRNRWQ
jgi:hypothetical protein